VESGALIFQNKRLDSGLLGYNIFFLNSELDTPKLLYSQAEMIPLLEMNCYATLFENREFRISMNVINWKLPKLMQLSLETGTSSLLAYCQDAEGFETIFLERNKLLLVNKKTRLVCFGSSLEGEYSLNKKNIDLMIYDFTIFTVSTDLKRIAFSNITELHILNIEPDQEKLELISVIIIERIIQMSFINSVHLSTLNNVDNREIIFRIININGDLQIKIGSRSRTSVDENEIQCLIVKMDDWWMMMQRNGEILRVGRISKN